MRILHWFRKDLRLDDNTSLAAASADAGGAVAICYISEPAILKRSDMSAARVAFVLECLQSLRAEIAGHGGDLILRHGDAAAEIVHIARETKADAVYWNAEYEPQLLQRDRAARAALEAAGVKVRVFHDRLLVAPGAVTTKDGRPHTVFTHFEKACGIFDISNPRPSVTNFLNLQQIKSPRFATAEKLGFHNAVRIPGAGEANAKKRLITFCVKNLTNYATARDFIDSDGTSRLSADLKFGTLSPRTIVKFIKDATASSVTNKNAAEKYISELRWRDFYAHILFNFPRVEKTCFKPDCEGIRWDTNDKFFVAWRDGKTGYPIIDASMRALRATGHMHNRARMIVASFFTKDLGLDWRLAEKVFMNELIDGDMASNNGGWQWAASTGTDAAPYFRIFNPILQSRKFDPEANFIKKWCPELSKLNIKIIHAPWEASPIELAEGGVRLGVDYPKPIVDHAGARERSLARFEKAKK